MSKKDSANHNGDEDEDEEEDDDYSPTNNAQEQSDASDQSEEDGAANDADDQLTNEKQNNLDVAPYDESKTNELWKSFTNSTKPSVPPSATIDKPKVVSEIPNPKPAATTVTNKVFDYAGEKVSVPSPTSVSLKRPAPSSTGPASVLDRLGIGKKAKLSTLEKSRLDWSEHKQAESLTDDLDSHRRGKDSYVEKKAFLQRSEVREHDHFLTNVKKK